MLKTELVRQILLQLENSLKTAVDAANTAHETATHEENVAENKYDTLGLEAAYLAEGLSRQVEELTVAIQTYRKLNLSEYMDGIVRLGAMLTLEAEDGQLFNYFIGPAGGGIDVRLDDLTYKVVTPTSPLGQELIGKEIDDEVTLMINGTRCLYVILRTK